MVLGVLDKERSNGSYVHHENDVYDVNGETTLTTSFLVNINKLSHEVLMPSLGAYTFNTDDLQLTTTHIVHGRENEVE